MRIRRKRFNIYLLGVLLSALFVQGCETLGKKKEASTLSLHLEVASDSTGKNGPVPIYRASPIYLNVENQPFLTEHNLTKAAVIDVLGGFAIFVQFDRQGTWLLEQYSIAGKGRHIAIMSQFGEGRWLAAPVMTKRITDGTLVFTPDATREESDRIVRGLNNVIHDMKQERWLKSDE